MAHGCVATLENRENCLRVAPCREPNDKLSLVAFERFTTLACRQCAFCRWRAYGAKTVYRIVEFQCNDIDRLISDLCYGVVTNELAKNKNSINQS